MTTEEKLDFIINKLSEKKGKDQWEKIQIMATIFTGLLTLLISAMNFRMTQIINLQSQKQVANFHREDSLRKERDEYIQELNALPKLMDMLTSKDYEIKAIGKNVLAHIKNSKNFKDHILDVVNEPKDEGPVVKQGGSYWLYLGQVINGQLDGTNFGITKVPNINSTLKTTTQIYKRESLPVYIKQSDSWRLGDIIGVVDSGKTVTIVDIERSGTETKKEYYWALVK